MWEAAWQGMLMLLSLKPMLYMLVGIMVGIVFGAIPGLSGQTALAVLIPFVIGTDPAIAMALLLGAHVAVEFGGSISAILINTPGTGQAIATCWDGYPMARKGEAARALSISATSSGVGGLFGFLILLVSLPVMRAMLMVLGSPEYFIMAFVGLTFIVILGGGSLIKAFISGGLGLLLSFIGLDPMTSVPRYTFGQLYFWDGIPLIPVVVGLFAFTEVAFLMGRGTSIAEVGEMRASRPLVWQGIKDTFQHMSMCLRCSAIGTIIGIIPGLGGTVANLAAYGYAAKTSKQKEEFGQGAIEGILAPESANNSKEGGALIPTIAFGIPGSAAMAILLGVFVMLGLVPGPEMLTKKLPYTFSIVWVLAISNIITTGIGLVFCGYLARFSFYPVYIITPFIIVVGLIGSYLDGNDINNVFLAVGFGILGYAMRKKGYSRAPLIIGLVLGKIVERYLHLSLKVYGKLFFLRPISLFLILIIIFAIASPYLLKSYRRNQGGEVR